MDDFFDSDVENFEVIDLGKLTRKEREDSLREFHDRLLTPEKREELVRNNPVEFSEKASLERRAFPYTLERYEELLVRYPQVREFSSFEKDDHHARAYYAIKELLRSGELSHLSARAQYRALSEQFSVEWGTIKPWFTKGSFPRNIHRLGTLEHSRLKTELGIEPTEKLSRQYIPSDLNEYEELLRIHPYTREHPDFETRDRYARVYFEVMPFREAHPDMSLTKTSEKFDITKGAVLSWIYRKAVPCIIQQLATYERFRIESESTIPQEGKGHQISPTIVYETLKPLHNLEDVSPTTIAESINRFCEMIPNDQQMVFAYLKPHHRSIDPRWLIDVGKSVEKNLSEVEQTLNERESDGNVRYKLGVVERTLYIWKRNIDHFGYLELFNDECFYFSKADGRELIDDAHKHLNLKGNHSFSKLLRQMTDIDEGSRKSVGIVTSDLRHDRNHLFGETLRFILDVTQRNLHDIAPKIRAIGQQEQIKTPRIIEGTELLILMARLYAITASDGHVGRKWNFLGYSEYNEDRIEIVNELVQSFGEVRYSYFYEKGKKFLVFPTKDEAGLRFPHVLGRLMIKLGMPSGDKCIQNVGLPDFILNGSLEIIRAYLEEVIPEDGYFSFSSKHQMIGIGRNLVLYDIMKDESYDFIQKLAPEHIKLIQKYGTEKKGKLVKGKGLAIGTIRELASSKDTEESIIASQLLRISLETPNSLLNDEHKIIVSLGLRCPRPRLRGVTWFETTNRVSSTWSLCLGDQISIAKWGILALPNDERKRKTLLQWMRGKPEKVRIAYDQLRRDGYVP